MINDFDSIEFDLIFKKILNDNISSNIKTVKEPKAYILGGQPGAGKSRLNNHLQTIKKSLTT